MSNWYVVLAHNDKSYIERFMNNELNIRFFSDTFIKEDIHRSLSVVHKLDNFFWSIAFNVSNEDYGKILKARILYPDILFLIYPMSYINNNFETMLNDLRQYAEHRFNRSP